MAGWQILLAKRGGIVYKYSTHLNFSAMKHAILSFIAVACGALSASALDATNARIWLTEGEKVVVASRGSTISTEKPVRSPAYERTWQYVSIPLHVEGKSREGRPHFIPELKVRISLAAAVLDDDGRPTGKSELLSREITYVDIPLAKSSDAGKKKQGEGLVKVGVFISPSNAFKLAPKDGDLSRSIIAVAVEGTFQGSSCNRFSEKANDKVTATILLNEKEGKALADKWWTKQGSNSGIVLSAISETPFAHEYSAMGFPGTNPVFGAPVVPVAAAPAVVDAPADAVTDGSVPGTDASSTSEVDSSSHGADGEGADTEEDSPRKGKKARKNRRSRR